MPQGTVEQILIAAESGEGMESLTSVQAEAGKGLVGDRYFNGTGTFSPEEQAPDYEVTLIEAENIEQFAQQNDIKFTASDARRNLVIRGARLNDLVDREFQIGTARIRAIRLCEPCAYLAKLTGKDVLSGLKQRGGLRAQITNSGTINVGDELVVDS